MRKNIALLPYCIVCVFLDTAVFSRWNLFSLRPWMMLALTLSAAACFSLQAGMVLGILGGFCQDILCGTAFGITPALFLLAAVLLHIILKKNTVKPYVLFLFLTALALGYELLLALLAWVLGGRVSLYGLLYGALPRALLTGGAGLLLKKAFRPLLKGQVDL